MRTAVYICAVGFVIASPSPDVVAKFNAFRVARARNYYTGEEFAKRSKYFEDHVKHVENLQKQERGTAVYTHLDDFADFSPEEKSKMFGFIHQQEKFEQLPEGSHLDTLLEASLDWVAKGAVNPVKNQGQCGSCWAFSTACNLEGAGFVASGHLVSVSEQEFVSCDNASHGCNGGLPFLALKWSSQVGGVASEQTDPYKSQNGENRVCSIWSAWEKIVWNSGYQRISKDEDQIAKALATYGPLSIAVDANGFHGYSHGVLRNPSCSKVHLNHAINVVGYGMDQIPYWKVRNSWSPYWGEKGYIRMYRGDCQCGLCTHVCTATGVSVNERAIQVHPGDNRVIVGSSMVPGHIAVSHTESANQLGAVLDSYNWSANQLGAPWMEQGRAENKVVRKHKMQVDAFGDVKDMTLAASASQ